MPMKVRPWKPPEKAMTAWRPVEARAILTAFSTASAPVVTKIVFLAKSPGVSAFRRSARCT
ncbi:hypothetical protein D9M68_700550 [compost metagenome]